LRDKTRIFVPDACLLIGTVDELDILKEGHVFLQIDRSPLLDAPQIIEGLVIVAKNPCFHPGDIRVLQVRRRLDTSQGGLSRFDVDELD
jgi:hypothetical protein